MSIPRGPWLRVTIPLILLVIFLAYPSHGQPCPTSWANASQFGVPGFFYPFLEGGDRIAPVNDDGSTAEIPINQGFVFFGRFYNSLWVNTNGVISFLSRVSQFTPSPFPIRNSVLIAVFWADVNTRRNNGRIYYRQTMDFDILCRCAAAAREKRVDLSNFFPSWAFVATWHNVTYFGGGSTTPINSFQIVLCTNGRHSFVVYNYGNITWTTGTASGGNGATGLGGTPAQVGFNAGDGINYFAVNSSRTSDIVNIDTKPSNTAKNGVWCFQIDDEEIIDGGCNTQGGILLGPNFGLTFGGKKVFLSGPCFDETSDIIVCKFDNEMVIGTVINQQRAFCITPMFPDVASVNVTVSTNGGTSFNFSALFFFVENDPPYTITRMELGRWLQAPYTDLQVAWDSNLFLPDDKLRLDVVLLDEWTTTSSPPPVIQVMRNIMNDGEVMLPPDLPIQDLLEDTASFCAIKISKMNESTPSECLWSVGHPCYWYVGNLCEEVDKRRANGDQLTEREMDIAEAILAAADSVNTPTFGFGRKKRAIPLLGRILIGTIVVLILDELGERADAYCNEWAANEAANPTDFSEVLPPPCTVEQAECDDRFIKDSACDGSFIKRITLCAFFHNGASVCYRSATASPSGYGQQACYNSDGNLITDPYRGGGTLDKSYAGTEANPEHIDNDVKPFLACCKAPSFDCSRYFRHRPTAPCTGYRPPNKGFTGGDPHIISGDLFNYTFNPIGTFSFVKSSFSEVQVRYDLNREDDGTPVSRRISVTRAIAMRGDNSNATLQIEPGRPSQRFMDVYVNGTVVDHTGYPLNTKIAITGNPNIVLQRISPGCLKITLQGPSGSSLQLTVKKNLDSLSVLTGMTFNGPSSSTGVTGLLGNYNGDPNDDLTNRFGDVLLPDSSPEDIHYRFGLTFNLTEQESFLTYPPGQSHSDVNQLRFVPNFLNETALLELNGDIAGLCGVNVRCRFDYFNTGSAEFANGTMQAISEVMEAARIVEESLAPCYGAPCGGSGTCSDDGTTIQCTCDDNYTGTLCESIISVCASGPCENNGICEPRNEGNTFLCFCPPEFSGERCELDVTGEVISPCLNSTCANGGTCLAANLEFTCICEEGYSGMRCEEVSDPCISFTCENGGRCISNITETECECLAGFSGDTCENVDPANPCQGITCLNGGTCYTDGATYTCDCRYGYTGLLCQSGTDVCLPNPCQNEGLCNYLDSAPGFVCGCLAGFSGDFCEIVDTTNPCGGFPCLNGGTCYLVGSSITCDCTTGYTGDICQSVVGVCLPNPCENEGICSITASYPGYQCLCPSGFGGAFCQRVDLANPCQSTSCLNGGTCFFDGSAIRCNCLSGYTGQFCDAIEDNCSPNPCLNGGMCSEMNGPVGFQCGCTAGYGGYICQIVDPSNPCDNSPCLNGGTCFFDGSRITCGCRVGYTGNLCASVAVGSCSSYPCRNGGSCTNRYDSIEYDCTCSAGFVGRNCEYVVSGGGCSTSPCENRGLCMNVYKDQYRCLCHAGFSGADCQIEDSLTPCRSFPCQYGGLCNYGNGVYYCICSQGYSGNDCEIDQIGCEIRRCINGGTCRSAAPGEIRRCLCEPGYTGKQCESDTICSPNPCKNGGSCTIMNNMASCECPEGFYGFYCHISNEQGSQALTVTIVSYGILAIVLLTVMGGILCMVNRRRNGKDSSLGNLGPVRMVIRGKF